MTPDQEAKQLLEIFDPKKTGYIDLAELEGVLIANGFMAEKDIILKLFASLDMRGTGRVPAKDIPRIFTPAFVDIENSINIRDAFTYFDSEDKGVIDAQDVMEAEYVLTEPKKHEYFDGYKVYDYTGGKFIDDNIYFD